MNFQKSLEFYNKYIKLTLSDRLSICRVDILLRNSILKQKKINNKKYKLKKNIQAKFKIYIAYCLLALYSIFNILKIKFKGIKIAHYMIDINNNDTFYDTRSKFILDILLPERSINFMHINNVQYSIQTLFKKENIIYFEAIYYVLKPFLKKQRYEYKKTDNKKANEILEINQNYYSDSYYIKKIVKFILQFLKVEKFIMLDDNRYTNELKLACSELNIKTIGYMHGRFNKYHLGIFEFPFDVYLVWSEYFKNMLLENKNYKDKEIIIICNPKLDKKIDFIQRGKNILWLGESNVNYEEIFHYIKTIKQLGHKVIFRGKPGANAIIDNFLKENNIEKDSSKSYFESLESNKIGLVVATYSTTLMESWLMGVPSIILKCSYDYGSHLWEDSLVELCESDESLESVIKNHLDMDEDEIKEKCIKIWDDDYVYDRDRVEKILKGTKP